MGTQRTDRFDIFRAWVDRTVAARILATMYMAGAAAGALSLVLPNAISSPGLVFVLVAASALVAVAIFLAGARLPAWTHFALISIGVAIIFAAALAGGVALATYSLMFVWMVLYSAYFFTERYIVAQLAWILGGYAVVIALVEPAEVSPPTLWLLTAMVLTVTAYALSTVVRHRTRAQRQLRKYFDLSLDMLCALRPDGTVLEANGAWFETMGYTPEALRDSSLIELLHPDDLEATEAAAERLMGGNDVIDFENRCRTAEGAWRWLNWRATFDPETGLIFARAADTTDRKKRLERVRSEARRDFLTGLPNRRWLAEELDREISRASRDEVPLSVGVLDLDHFKDFNDTHGHVEGDHLLRDSAESWAAALRPGDFIARIGGEEFVVLMPGCDLEQGVDVIERIRASTPSLITCSAGLAQWTPGEGVEQLLHRADLALYESKARGRDRVSLNAA